LFSLALAYKEQGRLEEARAGLERARTLDPRNGKVLWQLADVWMREGEAGKAEAVIHDALARGVDEHRFLLKLGESQIEAKQWREAEKSLTAALEKKPDLATARFNLGLVYDGAGRPDLALQVIAKALEIEPENGRLHYVLARLYQGLGDAERARVHFERARDLGFEPPG